MSLVACLVLLAVLALSPARAAEPAPEFAPIFNDGGILQCELPVNLWGQAAPGARVEVRLDGRVVAGAVAGADGGWRAVLPAQPPGGPRRLEAVAGAGIAHVEDVCFGEVWLATGQSNMVQPLRNATGGAEQLARTIPEIRFVRVPQRAGLPVERPLTAADLAWREFAPPQNQQIASVAFFFADELQRATGRRIGIVQSSFGGTPAQAWTPRSALDARPELRGYADALRAALARGRSKEEWSAELEAARRWREELAAWEKSPRVAPRPRNPGAGDPGNPWNPKSPTVLYENMIAPLVPFTARGVIWYQGEGNAGNPEEYRVLFPAMITAWRREWGRGDWPFLFVQLAAYGARAGNWPGLRAAQAFTRDTVPHTGMAVAIDCGEREQIHPAAKQPVGERLARLALAQVYGRSIESRGPLAVRAEAEGGRVGVHFIQIAAGLRADGGLPGFELAGSDGRFHRAQARLLPPDRVAVEAAEVPAPAAVRYAWADWIEPAVTLRNAAGLPAEPFALPVRAGKVRSP